MVSKSIQKFITAWKPTVFVDCMQKFVIVAVAIYSFRGYELSKSLNNGGDEQDRKALNAMRAI
jgi:hypothetical protein